MADYQKMYAVLCGAIDDALDDLQAIPLAHPCALRLRDALLTAEEIYVNTAPYVTGAKDKKFIQLRIDKYPDE